MNDSQGMDRWLGEAGKVAFRENLRAGFERVLDTPVKELIDIDAIFEAVKATNEPKVLGGFFRPVARAAWLIEIGRMRQDPEPLGTYAPPKARAAIETLLEQKGLLYEPALRQVLTHQAVEAGMRDVLYDALKEFSDKVNPFFADWGLPGLFKKLSPFGFGAMSKSLESVKKEFDRRLEPEIRSFLGTFTKRSSERMADFVITSFDQPSFIEMRKDVYAWLLKQPVSALLKGVSDRVVELIEEAAYEGAEAAGNDATTMRRQRATVEMLVQAHANQTLREALATYGATPELPIEAWADAIWPVVEAGLKAETVRAFVAGER